MSDAYSSFLKAMSAPSFEISVKSLSSDFFDSVLSGIPSDPNRYAMLVVERRVRLPRHTRVRVYRRERKGDRGKRKGKARWSIVRTTIPNARVDSTTVTNAGEEVVTVNWSAVR